VSEAPPAPRDPANEFARNMTPVADLRLPQTGGCQCGKIRYEITAPPRFVITSRALNGPVAHPVLKPPRIVAGIRQGIAAGMAQHVGVHRAGESGALADAHTTSTEMVAARRDATSGYYTRQQPL
jgi:hypothetical protein